MILVQGRMLNPPPVFYQGNKREFPRNASWNMRGKQFVKPGSLSNWSVLVLGTAVYDADNGLSFRTALANCGMAVATAQGDVYQAPFTVNDRDYDTSIRNALWKAHTDGVQMLFVILPDKNATNYSRVKYWADLKAGKSANRNHSSH